MSAGAATMLRLITGLAIWQRKRCCPCGTWDSMLLGCLALVFLCNNHTVRGISECPPCTSLPAVAPVP